MTRLLFYLLVSLDGDAMFVLGCLDRNKAEAIVGLVIAAGAWLMIATGWWMRWEQTVYPPEPTTASPFDWEID